MEVRPETGFQLWSQLVLERNQWREHSHTTSETELEKQQGCLAYSHAEASWRGPWTATASISTRAPFGRAAT